MTVAGTGEWGNRLANSAGRQVGLLEARRAQRANVAFVHEMALDPLPPVVSRDKDARYYHVYEGGEIDEERVAHWVRQAAATPGWDGF